MSIVGLDLAGVETRPSGYCSLENMTVITCLLYADKEILNEIQKVKPEIVAIDAPLSLPPGRKNINERTSGHLRESDKELLRRGIKFFPITLGPMRKLTERGINLRKILESKDFKVLEAYPGGAQDVLGIPRKQQGIENLRAGLEKLGLKGLSIQMSHHELDAVTCAYTGKLFLEGKAVIYGASNDGILMPKDELDASPVPKSFS